MFDFLNAPRDTLLYRRDGKTREVCVTSTDGIGVFAAETADHFLSELARWWDEDDHDGILLAPESYFLVEAIDDLFMLDGQTAIPKGISTGSHDIIATMFVDEKAPDTFEELGVPVCAKCHHAEHYPNPCPYTDTSPDHGIMSCDCDHVQLDPDEGESRDDKSRHDAQAEAAAEHERGKRHDEGD